MLSTRELQQRHDLENRLFLFAAGVSSLGAQFAKLRLGLKHLNFSKTSLSPKGTCWFSIGVFCIRAVCCNVKMLRGIFLPFCN